MDGFLIKTERTDKGPLKQQKQKQKRRHAIVLSDDDDAKAQAPADKFPEQFEAYIVRNGLPVVYSSELSIVFDRSGKFDGNWKALPLSWWRRRKVNSIAR